MVSTRLHRLLLAELLISSVYLLVTASERSSDCSIEMESGETSQESTLSDLDTWEIDLDIREISKVGKFSLTDDDLETVECSDMNTIKITGSFNEKAKGQDTDEVDLFFGKIVSCRHRIHMIVLNRTNVPLLSNLGLLDNGSSQKFSELEEIHVNITNKLITIGQIIEITQQFDHLSRVVVEMIQVDVEYAYERLHEINNCDEILIQYDRQTIRIDFKRGSIQLSDAKMIELVGDCESLQLIDATLPYMGEEFKQKLGTFDKILARTNSVDLAKMLTATRRSELALIINDMEGDLAIYFECHKYISVNVLHWQPILYIIPLSVESLIMFYDMTPTDCDLDILLNLKHLNAFTMVDQVIEEDMELPPMAVMHASTNAHLALFALLARFDANIHWPNLQSFDAFMPDIEHLGGRSETLIKLDAVRNFSNELPPTAPRDAYRLLFIKKLRCLFDMKSLSSFRLRFAKEQRGAINGLFPHMLEMDVFGWVFKVVEHQIVGTKDSRGALLTNPGMTMLTPNFTFDVTANTVTDADGKPVWLADMVTDGFDKLENFNGIEVRRSPTTETIAYNKLSDTFRDYAIRHILEIETVILKCATQQMLSDIGNFATRETATLRLQIEDAPSPIDYNVPHLEHLICSISDLPQFSKNVNVRTLALTSVGNGVDQQYDAQLANFISFVERNEKLTRILYNCSKSRHIKVPNGSTDASPMQLTDVFKRLHSSMFKREYDYLMLADSTGVISIDTDQDRLQTSAIALIDLAHQYSYTFTDLRVFITHNEVHTFCDLLPQFTESYGIKSLYISVHKQDAEYIQNNVDIKAFPDKWTIGIYDIDETTSERIPLDNITKERKTVELFMKMGYFTSFIDDDTETLLLFSDDTNINPDYLRSFALHLSKLNQLSRLDIRSSRLSLLFLEYASYDSYFRKLRTLLLNNVGLSNIQHKPYSDILLKTNLETIHIRNVAYERILQTSKKIRLTSEWTAKYFKFINFLILTKRAVVVNTNRSNSSDED